jgi:DEP domain-containing protein 5
MPSLTFSSYDAITWIMNRVEGVRNPLEILEMMREKSFIAHASGDPKVPIIPGFFMYYIVAQDVTSADYRAPLGDLEAFSYEWMEVEVPLDCIINLSDNQMQNMLNEKDVPMFLRDEFPSKNIDGKLYKVAHLEVDLMQKVIDRVEFGHARYHKQFVPSNAFEIVVQWVAASGPIIYDLVSFF